MKRISMIADFQILRNGNALSKNDISALSVGGYGFETKYGSLPFDWNAWSTDENNGIFHLETGYGFWNDFVIPNYWEDEYEDMGITRADITAELLASTTEINEFFVEFDIGNKTYSCGGYDASEGYSLKLIGIDFYDLDSKETFSVDQAVINKFNKGGNGIWQTESHALKL